MAGDAPSGTPRTYPEAFLGLAPITSCRHRRHRRPPEKPPPLNELAAAEARAAAPGGRQRGAALVSYW